MSGSEADDETLVEGVEVPQSVLAREEVCLPVLYL